MMKKKKAEKLADKLYKQFQENLIGNKPEEIMYMSFNVILENNELKRYIKDLETYIMNKCKNNEDFNNAFDELEEIRKNYFFMEDMKDV